MTGLAAGLGGMALALLLHAIQHIAFGYDQTGSAPPESFLQGVTNATPLRRLLSLLACGMLAGVGWYAVKGSRRSLVGVRQAVGDQRPGPAMPMLETVCHALLQIVTVSLGSPLGREVAPREIGALLAQRIGWVAALGEADRRLIVACGAGGGLAAVYNVPLGGTLFVLEVLLGSTSRKAVAIALLTCTISAVTAWVGLGDSVQYAARSIPISWSLVLWAGLAGPLLGAAATAFRTATAASAKAQPEDASRILLSIVVFGCIGLAATSFPQLLGNGRGPIQLALDGRLGLILVFELLLLKLAAVLGSLRAGAAGGLLTPGMTIGALIALLLGAAWNCIAPPQLAEAYAIVGAAAFLAASMEMPLTAIVLMLEFTRVDHDFLVPITLAVAGSMGARSLLVRPHAAHDMPGKPGSISHAALVPVS
jgi:H+/Cl- antiporter ClcA